MTYEGIDHDNIRGTDLMALNNNRNPPFTPSPHWTTIKRGSPARFYVLLYDTLYLQPVVMAPEG
jgi:hypothetical protein